MIFRILFRIKKRRKKKKMEVRRTSDYGSKQRFEVRNSMPNALPKAACFIRLKTNCRDILVILFFFSFVFVSFPIETVQFVRSLSSINIWLRCNENSTDCSGSNCTHQWKQGIASAGLRGGARLLSFRNKEEKKKKTRTQWARCVVWVIYVAPKLKFERQTTPARSI